MTIEGNHHVAVGVRDFDEAVESYGWLGLAELPQLDFPFPGAWLEAGHQQVHLMETDVASPTAANKFAFHYAVHVDDLDATLDLLATDGAEAQCLGRQALVWDLGGNVVELHDSE